MATISNLPNIVEATDRNFAKKLQAMYNQQQTMVEEVNTVVDILNNHETNAKDNYLDSYDDTEMLKTYNNIYKQNYKGDWVSGSNYTAGDCVTYNSLFYDIIASVTNSTTAPPSDTTHFKPSHLSINVVSNINSPIFEAPLKNSLKVIKGIGDSNDEVTFTRSTTGTYIDRYGILKTAAANEARFEKEGLLIEGSSTNLLYKSNDISNNVWIKYNCSVTTETIIDPTGTSSNVYKLVENKNYTTDYHYSYQPYLTSINDYFTFSAIVKAAERDVCLFMYNGGHYFVNFELRNDGSYTIYAPNSSYWTDYSAKIVKMANGWYRCAITAKKVTGSIVQTTIQLKKMGNNDDRQYIGNGQAGVYVYDTQLEQLPFMTSQITNTSDTSTVTRTADICYVIANNNIPEFNQKRTIAIDWDFLSGNKYYNINRNLLTTNNVIIIGYGFGYSIYAVAYGKGHFWNYNIGKLILGRLIYVNNLVSGKIFANGELIANTTDTGTGYSLGTIIYLGSYMGIGNFLYGHISNIRIWDFALTDIEAEMA